MKTLYISDLDGTLLNEKVELSNYTINTLNKLINQGIYFTIATARTAASVCRIVESIHLNIPVILMNGVVIYDVTLKEYKLIHRLPAASVIEIINVLKDYNVTGFMYEIKNNILNTYYERLESKALKEFHDERVNRYQKKFIQISDFHEIDPENIIYFALLDKKENLEGVFHKLKNNSNISITFYKDIYSEDDLWYLEIFSKEATKYNAAKYIKEQYGFDYMIGFGDNLNDIPLFEACDSSCAVENAKDEVKAHASFIIKSNLKDGVADWIHNNYLKYE